MNRTRTKELQARVGITLERIEMFNGMIERTKKYMPDDVYMLKDRENIRNEMIKELYALLAELGIHNPQQDIGQTAFSAV